MKKLTFILFVAIAIITFNSCNEDEEFTANLGYISFESTDMLFGVDMFSSSTHAVKVYTSQKTGSDRTFTVQINEGASTMDVSAVTLPQNVTVPANSNMGSFDLTIEDKNIGENGKVLVLELVPVSGTTTGVPITLDVYQICPLNEVVLTIDFDSWPEETSWELLDSDSQQIYIGGPYPGESDLRKAFCLENGTYTFNVYDSYGDGTGPVRLTFNGTDIQSWGAYDFGSSATVTFTVP